MTQAGSPKKSLAGKVALVTGASRGVGKGVAIVLGEAGATVYVTGRRVEQSEASLPGTLRETADEIERRGGTAVVLHCDHDDDAQMREVAERIGRDAGRLDVLVNNVFALPKGEIFAPFWKLPLSVWDSMHRVGLRSHYVMASLCAPMMIEAKSGLIANISSFGAASYQVNVAYGVGKAAVDRLARDLAHDLRPFDVASVSLWPGVVRTERIMAMKDDLPWPMDVTESPELTGRAVRALASDPAIMKRSGHTLVVAELAKHYGFHDIDGSQPLSLRELSEKKRQPEKP